MIGGDPKLAALVPVFRVWLTAGCDERIIIFWTEQAGIGVDGNSV